MLRADTVPVAEREAWIAAQDRRGIQVILCHPKLVEVGLDLIEHPDCLFYQPGYSLFTLRQASRRAWRIGQSQPVTVRFLAYSGTLQSAALLLMSRKLDAAEAIEGRMGTEGLKALAADTDDSLALARMLAGGLEGLHTAEDAWRAAAAAATAPPVASAAVARPQRATLADLNRHTRVVERVEGRGGKRVLPGQLVLDLDLLLGRP